MILEDCTQGVEHDVCGAPALIQADVSDVCVRETLLKIRSQSSELECWGAGHEPVGHSGIHPSGGLGSLCLPFRVDPSDTRQEKANVRVGAKHFVCLIAVRNNFGPVVG